MPGWCPRKYCTPVVVATGIQRFNTELGRNATAIACRAAVQAAAQYFELLQAIVSSGASPRAKALEHIAHDEPFCYFEIAAHGYAASIFSLSLLMTSNATHVAMIATETKPIICTVVSTDLAKGGRAVRKPTICVLNPDCTIAALRLYLFTVSVHTRTRP